MRPNYLCQNTGRRQHVVACHSAHLRTALLLNLKIHISTSVPKWELARYASPRDYKIHSSVDAILFARELYNRLTLNTRLLLWLYAEM